MMRTIVFPRLLQQLWHRRGRYHSAHLNPTHAGRMRSSPSWKGQLSHAQAVLYSEQRVNLSSLQSPSQTAAPAQDERRCRPQAEGFVAPPPSGTPQVARTAVPDRHGHARLRRGLNPTSGIHPQELDRSAHARSKRGRKR
eukprot:6210761-Pleurochrysis_carterae.AAC.4